MQRSSVIPNTHPQRELLLELRQVVLEEFKTDKAAAQHFGVSSGYLSAVFQHQFYEPHCRVTLLSRHGKDSREGEMMFQSKPKPPWNGPRYEYIHVQWPRHQMGAAAQTLNKYGQDGWQAVTVCDGYAYMMRASSDAPTTPQA